MSQERTRDRLRPLSHNVYSYNQEYRSQTAQTSKPKSGTIYKGNFLSKALSPLNQEALAFQQRIRPITTGGIQYPYYSSINKSNPFSFHQQQKPRTAVTSGTTKSRISQSIQFGKTNNGQGERNMLDFNLVESEIYPGIYYAKTSLRNLLKEIQFPKSIKSLPPEDYRLNLIYQIISKLFHEITFYLFNILICQHEITQNYLIFFSDAESVPFSKCCNSPVYIELYESGTGRIMCNDKLCSMNLLTEFVINFEDGQNLWKENQVFNTNQQQDTQVRRQVSKLITTGFFKHKSIVKEVKKMQKTTLYNKPLLQIEHQMNSTDPQQQQQQYDQNYQQNNNNYNPFLTAQEDAFQAYYSQKPYGLNQQNVQPEFQDHQFQNNHQFNNYHEQQFDSKKSLPYSNHQNYQHFNENNNNNKIPLLNTNKLKIDQGELISMNQKITNGLVQNSQVFNKEFKFSNNINNNTNKNWNSMTQNKWRPQSTSSMDTKEFRFKNNNNNNNNNQFNNTQTPSIRLKSGFNKDRKNKTQQLMQNIQILNADDFEKQQEEEKTLLDIKNMINDILQ